MNVSARMTPRIARSSQASFCAEEDEDVAVLVAVLFAAADAVGFVAVAEDVSR